ncbi:Putative prolin-rich extensin-like receptor protein kinase family protein [Zea mays]|uniref:Putative prolin-rich extensin-like receptor protein kinase family protein n=1 Tax=Zea mays TaxID=4577 RepID=A0A1D6LTP0_MAIZE|nr:Putative prolin-rich extensin-like receptor protein kinase family protein [Zea mays]
MTRTHLPCLLTSCNFFHYIFLLDDQQNRFCGGRVRLRPPLGSQAPADGAGDEGTGRRRRHVRPKQWGEGGAEPEFRLRPPASGRHPAAPCHRLRLRGVHRGVRAVVRHGLP